MLFHCLQNGNLSTSNSLCKSIVNKTSTFRWNKWPCGSFTLNEGESDVITVRNEVAKVMFLQVCVCPRGGGVCLSACGDTTPPREQTPPEQTSREQTPQQQTSPGADPPPRGETATAADGTHPTGMHSCFQIDSKGIQYT